jgi:polynucleotide 5'-kinase involved in rRNA processing
LLVGKFIFAVMIHLRSSLVRARPTVSRCLAKQLTVTTSFSTPEQLINDCLKIRSSVQTLNDKLKGPLEKDAQKSTALPFVFLLGNHSSGKSSFINYVCQRKIQTAGVAPTDDSFTVICPGIVTLWL